MKIKNEKLAALFEKYKDVIPYGIFGVLTTLVNIVSYWIFAHPFGCNTLVSTVIAWVLSVLFAYFTNRKWVFHSQAHGAKEIISELVSFFACRLGTGVLDTGCMVLFVDILHMNDVVIKVLANVLVIVLNYVASKWLIFRDKKSQ